LDFRAAFGIGSLEELDVQTSLNASKSALINMGALLLVFLVVWMMMLFVGILVASVVALIHRLNEAARQPLVLRVDSDEETDDEDR
jgi:MFS superfamily sulfate permease-like transporter